MKECLVVETMCKFCVSLETKEQQIMDEAEAAKAAKDSKELALQDGISESRVNELLKYVADLELTGLAAACRDNAVRAYENRLNTDKNRVCRDEDWMLECTAKAANALVLAEQDAVPLVQKWLEQDDSVLRVRPFSENSLDRD